MELNDILETMTGRMLAMQELYNHSKTTESRLYHGAKLDAYKEIRELIQCSTKEGFIEGCNEIVREKLESKSPAPFYGFGKGDDVRL